MVRPSKLTEGAEFSILQLLEDGNSQEVAAQASGITPTTFYNWMKRAEKGDAKFKAFAEKVKIAKAKAEARNVSVVSKAAEKSWQAAAWWLERTNPDRWARREDYRREAEKPTSIKIFIEGEEEEDADREGTRDTIQAPQSPT